MNKKIVILLTILVILIALLLLFISPKTMPPQNMPLNGQFPENLTKHCSTYFAICLSDKNNEWVVLGDTKDDFSLANTHNGLFLFAVNSDVIRFDDSEPGFATISVLGNQKQVYRELINGSTYIFTGADLDGHSLILSLVSDNEISGDEVSKVVGAISRP